MIALLLATALGGPCDLPAPSDAPFAIQSPKDAGQVHLLLTFPLDDANPLATRAFLGALEDRGLTAAVGVRSDSSPAVLSEAADAITRGHAVYVRLSPRQVGTDSQTGPLRLRKTLRPVTRVVGKLRIVEMAFDHPAREPVLHRVGLKAVLEREGLSTGQPRRQARFEAQPNNGVVFPSGPYAGSCGATPVIARFTPATADRVTQALHGASAAPIGIVRVVVTPSEVQDAEVLERWLDDVVLPAGVQVTTPLAARDVALTVLPKKPTTTSPTQTAGRLVPIADLHEAAELLPTLDVLPGHLPGDLNITEAFIGFALLLAGETEDQVVRLRSLQGPPLRAPAHTLEVPCDDVRKLAERLLTELPEAMPAALPLGGKVVAAPELLTLFAAAVRGETTCRTSAIEPVDATRPDLGWGRSN